MYVSLKMSFMYYTFKMCYVYLSCSLRVILCSLCVGAVCLFVMSLRCERFCCVVVLKIFFVPVKVCYSAIIIFLCNICFICFMLLLLLSCSCYVLLVVLLLLSCSVVFVFLCNCVYVVVLLTGYGALYIWLCIVWCYICGDICVGAWFKYMNKYLHCKKKIWFSYRG